MLRHNGFRLYGGVRTRRVLKCSPALAKRRRTSVRPRSLEKPSDPERTVLCHSCRCGARQGRSVESAKGLGAPPAWDALHPSYDVYW